MALTDIYNVFMAELKTLLQGKIDDCLWIENLPGLEAAKLLTKGKDGRFIAIVFRGGPLEDLVGGTQPVWDFEIYNLVTGVWHRGSGLSERAPVLLADMQTLRKTVDTYPFAGVCAVIATRDLGTGDFTLMTKTGGLNYGCHVGFVLQVRILDI